MQICTDPATIDAQAWDALVRATCQRLHPGLRHAFLLALHTSGCASADSGWSPAFVLLWRGKRLVGAVPLYGKTHSYGEYVFDWAWADAYAQHGLAYYPKWLVAIPFSPIGAPKLLALDDEARTVLAQVLVEHVRASGWSSLHVLFAIAPEVESLSAQGLMPRDDVQFHWRNPGFADFEAYLASLNAEKRRKVRAERRKVAQAGVRLRWVLGHQAQAAEWAFVERCYRNTYHAHGATPYLNHAFFTQLARTMGEQVLLVLAERDGAPIAATLSLFDDTTLYGRYWGAVEAVSGLHFEACYYTPIEFCIARGLHVFEGGAQGEHKLARGFAPVRTTSLHWLAHPEFAEAVERYLSRESRHIASYLDELHEHLPFRTHHTVLPEVPE